MAFLQPMLEVCGVSPSQKHGTVRRGGDVVGRKEVWRGHKYSNVHKCPNEVCPAEEDDHKCVQLKIWTFMIL